MPSESQSAREQGFAILEQIHSIGLPTKENIEQISALVDQLQIVAPHFHVADQQGCVHMAEIIARIKDSIEREGEVPVKLFAELNRKYIMLKTGLQQHSLEDEMRLAKV